MTRLLLIRHGETDWNRAHRIQGATDIPLNDTGRAQARAAAATVRTLLDADAPAVIATSDLARARETAEIVATELELSPPWATPLLRERSYGEAEGMQVEEYWSRYGRGGTAAVPGAESGEHLRERAMRGIRGAVAEARRRTGAGGGALLLATHGGLIREMIGFASGGAFPLAGERIENGSVHELLVERDRLRLRSYTAV